MLSITFKEQTRKYEIFSLARNSRFLFFFSLSLRDILANKYQGLKITRVYDRDTAFLTIEDVDTDGDVIGRMTRSRTG